MKINKPGKIIPFVCSSCDCEFDAGIHAVATPDKGENYYTSCPMCGAECHADVARIQEALKKCREEQNASD